MPVEILKNGRLKVEEVEYQHVQLKFEGSIILSAATY